MEPLLSSGHLTSLKSPQMIHIQKSTISAKLSKFTLNSRHSFLNIPPIPQIHIHHRQPPPASTTGDLTLLETTLIFAAVAEKVRKTEPAGNHLRRRETRHKNANSRESERQLEI
ncbi:hypothetical protein LXL04_033041 [Taraxacum kok-saghyz]